MSTLENQVICSRAMLTVEQPQRHLSTLKTKIVILAKARTHGTSERSHGVPLFTRSMDPCFRKDDGGIEVWGERMSTLVNQVICERAMPAVEQPQRHIPALDIRSVILAKARTHRTSKRSHSVPLFMRSMDPFFRKDDGGIEVWGERMSTSVNQFICERAMPAVKQPQRHLSTPKTKIVILAKARTHRTSERSHSVPLFMRSMDPCFRKDDGGIEVWGERMSTLVNQVICERAMPAVEQPQRHIPALDIRSVILAKARTHRTSKRSHSVPLFMRSMSPCEAAAEAKDDGSASSGKSA